MTNTYRLTRPQILLHACNAEGLSFTYRFNLYRNLRYMDESGAKQLKCLLPCTALSVVKILEAIGAYDPRCVHVNQQWAHLKASTC